MAPLWTPSAERIARARLTHFMRHVAATRGADCRDYEELYDFSIRRPEDFWRAVWEFCEVIGESGERAAIHMDRMPGAEFYPDGRLNFAENVLRQRGTGPALIFNGENQVHRTISHDELREDVGRFGAALAAASIGAVWSSGSPDFGVQGLLDRFGQIEPRVLIAADGYFYGGKTHDIRPRLAEAPKGRPTGQP